MTEPLEWPDICRWVQRRIEDLFDQARDTALEDAATRFGIDPDSIEEKYAKWEDEL